MKPDQTFPWGNTIRLIKAYLPPVYFNDPSNPAKKILSIDPTSWLKGARLADNSQFNPYEALEDASRPDWRYEYIRWVSWVQKAIGIPSLVVWPLAILDSVLPFTPYVPLGAIFNFYTVVFVIIPTAFIWFAAIAWLNKELEYLRRAPYDADTDNYRQRILNKYTPETERSLAALALWPSSELIDALIFFKRLAAQKKEMSGEGARLAADKVKWVLGRAMLGLRTALWKFSARSGLEFKALEIFSWSHKIYSDDSPSYWLLPGQTVSWEGRQVTSNSELRKSSIQLHTLALTLLDLMDKGLSDAQKEELFVLLEQSLEKYNQLARSQNDPGSTMSVPLLLVRATSIFIHPDDLYIRLSRAMMKAPARYLKPIAILQLRAKQIHLNAAYAKTDTADLHASREAVDYCLRLEHREDGELKRALIGFLASVFYRGDWASIASKSESYGEDHPTISSQQSQALFDDFKSLLINHFDVIDHWMQSQAFFTGLENIYVNFLPYLELKRVAMAHPNNLESLLTDPLSDANHRFFLTISDAPLNTDRSFPRSALIKIQNWQDADIEGFYATALKNFQTLKSNDIQTTSPSNVQKSTPNSGARLANENSGPEPEKWPMPTNAEEARRVFRELESASELDLADFLRRFEKFAGDGRVPKEVVAEFMVAKTLHTIVQLNPAQSLLWGKIVKTFNDLQDELRRSSLYRINLAGWRFMIQLERSGTAEESTFSDEVPRRLKHLSMHRHVTDVADYIDGRAAELSRWEEVDDAISDKLRVLHNLFFNTGLVDENLMDGDEAKQIIFEIAQREPEDFGDNVGARLAEKTDYSPPLLSDPTLQLPLNFSLSSPAAEAIDVRFKHINEKTSSVYRLAILVDGEEEGSVDFSVENKELVIQRFYPYGVHGYGRQAQFERRALGWGEGSGRASMVMSWLMQLAKKNNLSVTNDGTKSSRMFHLYRKFFADRIKTDSFHDMSLQNQGVLNIADVDRQWGLFSYLIAGRVSVTPDGWPTDREFINWELVYNRFTADYTVRHSSASDYEHRRIKVSEKGRFEFVDGQAGAKGGEIIEWEKLLTVTGEVKSEALIQRDARLTEENPIKSKDGTRKFLVIKIEDLDASDLNARGILDRLERRKDRMEGLWRTDVVYYDPASRRYYFQYIVNDNNAQDLQTSVRIYKKSVEIGLNNLVEYIELEDGGFLARIADTYSAEDAKSCYSQIEDGLLYALFFQDADHIFEPMTRNLLRLSTDSGKRYLIYDFASAQLPDGLGVDDGSTYLTTRSIIGDFTNIPLDAEYLKKRVSELGLSSDERDKLVKYVNQVLIHKGMKAIDLSGARLAEDGPGSSGDDVGQSNSKLAPAPKSAPEAARLAETEEAPRRLLDRTQLPVDPVEGELPGRERLFQKDPSLRLHFMQAILARAVEHQWIPIESQDRVVSFEIVGNSIFFLDRDGRRIMDGDEPVQFTPTAKDIASAKKSTQIGQALAAKPNAPVVTTPTLTDLLIEREAKAKAVQDLLELYLVKINDTSTLSVAKSVDAFPDLDLDHPELFDVYADHYLDTLLELYYMSLNGFKGLDGVTFRLTGDKARVERLLATKNGKFLLEKKILTRERPMAQDGAPIKEIALTSAESIESGDWLKEAPYLPESKIVPGQDVHFKAYNLLAIFAGRVKDASNPPDSFVEAYRVVLGDSEASKSLQKPIVSIFLLGQTNQEAIKAAIFYALRPIRAIAWTQVVQLYSNVRRIVAQAA